MLKIVRMPDLPAGADGVFHGPVEPGGEEKADADLLEALLDDLRRRVDLDPQGLQDVGAPAAAGDGAVAVLGHGETRRRDDEGRRGGDVEGVPAVAARCRRCPRRRTSGRRSASPSAA